MLAVHKAPETAEIEIVWGNRFLMIPEADVNQLIHLLGGVPRERLEPTYLSDDIVGVPLEFVEDFTKAPHEVDVDTRTFIDLDENLFTNIRETPELADKYKLPPHGASPPCGLFCGDLTMANA